MIRQAGRRAAVDSLAAGRGWRNAASTVVLEDECLPQRAYSRRKRRHGTRRGRQHHLVRDLHRIGCRNRRYGERLLPRRKRPCKAGNLADRDMARRAGLHARHRFRTAQTRRLRADLVDRGDGYHAR